MTFGDWNDGIVAEAIYESLGLPTIDQLSIAADRLKQAGWADETIVQSLALWLRLGDDIEAESTSAAHRVVLCFECPDIRFDTRHVPDPQKIHSCGKPLCHKGRHSCVLDGVEWD